MAEALAKLLTKNQYIIYLDVKRDFTYEASQWERIDKSTILEMNMNEITEEYDFIDQANPVTEVEGNKPEFPQEIRTLEGNAIHDFMEEHFYDMPVGESCKVPYMFLFGSSKKRAWRGIATITNKSFNGVDKKYSYTLESGGDTEKGTYSISMGKPTFSPASLPASDLGI